MGNKTFIVIVILALGIAIYTYFFLKKRNEQKYTFEAKPDPSTDWLDYFTVTTGEVIYNPNVSTPTLGDVAGDFMEDYDFGFSETPVMNDTELYYSNVFIDLVGEDKPFVVVDGYGMIAGTNEKAEEGW